MFNKSLSIKFFFYKWQENNVITLNFKIGNKNDVSKTFKYIFKENVCSFSENGFAGSQESSRKLHLYRIVKRFQQTFINFFKIQTFIFKLLFTFSSVYYVLLESLFLKYIHISIIFKIPSYFNQILINLFMVRSTPF